MESNTIITNKKMKSVCKYGTCTGCMACISACHKNAIKLVNTNEIISAVVEENICINCGNCENICPNNVPPDFFETIYWKQGWSINNYERESSSSGGVASALMRTFIKRGGYVASCLFRDGEFVFMLTNNPEDVRYFVGSKYVKSIPGKIYIEIKEKLIRGNLVLFIGLPCQVAGVKNYCKGFDGLFTIDLICHGTPMINMLKLFLKTKKRDLLLVKNIKFREGNMYGISCDGESFTPRRVIDNYMLAFLYGLNYTDNCYSCRYAKIKRCSDITLGDAWGQLSEKCRSGVTLVMGQTNKGIRLIKNAELCLNNVDVQKVIKANLQLTTPKKKHSGRKIFFWLLSKGYSFDKAVIVAMPKEYIKEYIKIILIKLQIIKDYI